MIVTVARHRNAHRAGAELGLSQPAISKIVREAETVVGATLFDRGAPGDAPQSPGRGVFIARAVGILNDLARAGAKMEAIIGGPAGHLRLGVIPFVTPTLISGTLRAWRARASSSRWTIHEARQGSS